MKSLKNIIHWYFTKSALPYWAIVLFDSLIVFLSGWLVSVITEGTVASILQWKSLSLSMLAYLVCYIVGMRVFYTYSGVIRHSSFWDLFRVLMGNTLSLMLTFPLRLLLSEWGLAVLGYYDLVAVFLIATLGMWCLRVGVKYLYDIVH